MELRRFSQLHYIHTIINGSLVKAQNIFKGRPSIKYKNLADVYADDDAKKAGSDSEFHSKDEFETKVELPCPSFVERKTKNIDFDDESDCHVDNTEENEGDDFGFGMMTLKEIMRRCIEKKRKRSDDDDMIDETVCYGSPSGFCHTESEPEDEIDDQEAPLSSWKNKLKSKRKLKKKRKNKSVCSSPSSAMVVKSEPYQDGENLQLCVVDDLPPPVSVKAEPLEVDYSECRSVVCISDKSIFTADEYDADHITIDPELPLNSTEIDDDEHNKISHVDSCGETMELNPSEETNQLSGFGSDGYANHPCRVEIADKVPAGIPDTSGCNILRSPSSNDEIPGLDSSKVQVQDTNMSGLVNGSHMSSSSNNEFISSHAADNGRSHSSLCDAWPSDSEMYNNSNPASLSASHENCTISKSLGFTGLFDSDLKDDETLHYESGISRNHEVQFPPSDSVVNGTCPTAKACNSSQKLNVPASSDSCVVSVENSFHTIKDPLITDSAAKSSAGTQVTQHYDGDAFATSAGNGSIDNPKLRRPQRLLSTRKIISPGSQKRLRQILECIDLEDDESFKCREKLYAGKYSPDESGRADNPCPNRGFEVAVKPKLPEVKSKPKLIMKKPKDYMNDMLPKDTIEIQRHSRRMPNVSTGCDSFKSWSQSVVEYSQRQMQDMDRLTVKLLDELKSMKDIFEETLKLGVQPANLMRYKTDKVQKAINNAKRVEETTRKRLSTMSKDCNRFCKIMVLTGEGSAVTTNAASRERKVTFADEAGGELCRIKLFEADAASGVQSELPEAGVYG